MNAYELADEVEMWGRDLLALNMKGGVPCIEGARMLRQLQDDLSDLQRHIPVNAKPVAWISRLPEGDVYNCAWAEKQNDDDIPLYTHPVKELDEQFKKGFEAGKEEGWKAHKFHHPVKELTDEEIDMLAHEYNCIDDYPHEFVRACIRKAQEK